MQYAIPKQVATDSASQKLSSRQAKQLATQALQGLVIGNFLLNLVMQVIMLLLYRACSLQNLWGSISVMQLIINMPLLNVNYPSNAVLFYGFIGSMASFNFIPHFWENYQQYTDLVNDADVSDLAVSLGFTTNNIILNLGTLILLIIGYIFTIPFVLLLRTIKSKHRLLEKLYSIMHDVVFFSYIVRTFLLGYISLTMTASLNILYLQWDNWFSSCASVAAILLFSAICLFPFIIWVILWANFSKLGTEKSKKMFGSIYQELKTESRIGLLYNTIFTLRRLIFLAVAIFLADYPGVQVSIIIFNSILVLAYIAAYRPFEESTINKLEFFNEVCITIGSYHLIMFTNYITDVQLQYNVGWSMIGLTALNILVNMGVAFWESVKRLKIKVKVNFRKFNNWRMRRFDLRQKIYSAASLEKSDGDSMFKAHFEQTPDVSQTSFQDTIKPQGLIKLNSRRQQSPDKEATQIKMIKHKRKVSQTLKPSIQKQFSTPQIKMVSYGLVQYPKVINPINPNDLISKAKSQTKQFLQRCSNQFN